MLDFRFEFVLKGRINNPCYLYILYLMTIAYSRVFFIIIIIGKHVTQDVFMTPLVQKLIFVYFSKTISFSTPSHYNAPTHKQINQKKL